MNSPSQKGHELNHQVGVFFSNASEGERKSPGDAEIEKLSSSDAYWAWREEAMASFCIFFLEEDILVKL